MWLTETHSDEMYNGLNLSNLAMDEAYVQFSDTEFDISLWAKYEECFRVSPK